MKKKESVWNLFNKPLLARFSIPIFAVIVAGLSFLILRMPPSRAPQKAAASQPVLALFLEWPPESAKDNAAYYYQKAFIKLLDLFKSDRAALTDAQLLEQAQPIFRLFYLGTRLQKCDFTFGGKLDTFKNSLRRSLSRVYLSHIIFLKVDADMKAGRVDEALETFRQFFVYMIQLSKQRHPLANVELIAGKQEFYKKMKDVIESGKLSLAQERALLLLMLVEEKYELPLAETMRAMAEGWKKQAPVLPKEIAAPYNRLSGEYFAAVDRMLASRRAAMLPEIEAKRGSLSKSDPGVIELGHKLTGKSNIDKKLVMVYLSNPKNASRLYEEVAKGLFAAAAPAFGGLYEEYFLSCAQWDLLKTALALKLFKAEQSKFPDTLFWLTPGILPRLEKDPYSETTLSLDDDGDGVVISSQRQGLAIRLR